MLCLFAMACRTDLDPNFCPGLDCTTGTGNSSIVYSTLYSDDFDRADETPMVSPPWSIILVGGDNIEVKSNEVSPTESDASDPPGALHETNVPGSNVRVSVSVRIAGAGYAGEMLVYARSQASGDILNTYFCGVDPTTFRVTIGKRNAGVASGVAVSTSTITYNNGDTYTLTFTAEGSSLTCAVSGSDSASVSGTDSDFSSGYAGLAGGENGNNVLFFDDFLVETGS